MNRITYSPPRWGITRWLLKTNGTVSPDIHSALIATLFGTLPIFAGGVANTIVMAMVAYSRQPSIWFLAWLIMEVALGVIRVVVLLHTRRAAAAGQSTPTDFYFFLSLCWAASVGYGTSVSILSGDWVIAALACLSAAAMAGGICFRNFGAPRLASVMMLLSMGPIAVSGAFSGEPIFLLALPQILVYLVSMTVAALKLNQILVVTMQAEKENERRADHDPLTGLMNRTGLQAALANRFRRGNSVSYGLFFLDLNGFKQVNDSYGHPAGDALLKAVAERLAFAVAPGDLIGRMGGDEFVVLARSERREEAQMLADKLIDVIDKPFSVDGHELAVVGVCVGVALAPEHGTDFKTLLAIADVALYRAKSSGISQAIIAPRPPEGADAQVRESALMAE